MIDVGLLNEIYDLFTLKEHKEEILELDDGWGIISEDGTNAAHYENTILITEKEPEILTIL